MFFSEHSVVALQCEFYPRGFMNQRLSAIC